MNVPCTAAESYFTHVLLTLTVAGGLAAPALLFGPLRAPQPIYHNLRLLYIERLGLDYNFGEGQDGYGGWGKRCTD